MEWITGAGMVLALLAVVYGLSRLEAIRAFWGELMSIGEYKSSLLGYMSLTVFVFTLYMCYHQGDIPERLLTFSVTVIGCFGGAVGIYAATTTVIQKVRSGDMSGAFNTLKDAVKNVASDTSAQSSSMTTTTRSDAANAQSLAGDDH